MVHTLQPWVLLLMVIPTISIGAHAEKSDSLPPELEVWGSSVELRGGGGYNDNLLLDDSNRESSYYLSSGTDLTIWRLPVDRHQFLLLISGDYFAYPEGKELNYESSAVGVAQYKNMLSRQLEFIGMLQYSYIDQVIGVLTATNFNPVPVRAHIVGARPALRYYLSSPWWLEAEAYVSRHYFASPLDDLYEFGPRLRLGREYRNRSSWQVAYKYTNRNYDHQKAFAKDGSSLNHVLHTEQHDLETTWIHHWDKEKRWRSSTHAGGQILRDNGSGFFDFNRLYFGEKLRYRKKPWEVEAQLRLSYYDFLVQRTSPDGGETSEKTLISLQLKASREIAKNLSIYGEFRREESLSNRDGDDYRANKIGVGVDWEY